MKKQSGTFFMVHGVYNKIFNQFAWICYRTHFVFHMIIIMLLRMVSVITLVTRILLLLPIKMKIDVAVAKHVSVILKYRV